MAFAARQTVLMDAARIELLFSKAMAIAELDSSKPETELDWASESYRAQLARVDSTLHVLFAAQATGQSPARFKARCMVLLLEEDALMGSGFFSREWSPGDPPIAHQLWRDALAQTARKARLDTRFQARRQALSLARDLEQRCAVAAPRTRPRI